MAARNGQEFVEGLRRAPREVWISGRRVGDITTDPVFRRPIQSIAQLYDLQSQPERREVMTYGGDGGLAGTSFMIPRTHADLVKRRESMKVWADATFGMVGRSPDYLNTVLMTWAEGADFFGQRGEQFAQNVRNYYGYCRDRDLFLTHAIVNPQSDRSKGSHQQDNAFVHLGVVDETPDGLIVRGAKMLATHGPTADELLVYPLPAFARARSVTSWPSAFPPRHRVFASFAASRSTPVCNRNGIIRSALVSRNPTRSACSTTC